MKNNKLDLAGWFGRLMLVVCLVTVMSGMAAAATVSGTVTNNSTKTGRVYLLVGQSMGGTTGLGVSIAPTDPDWPNFIINGVPDGNYVLIAVLDNMQIGIPHANDPAGLSSPFTVSGTPVNVNVTLEDATPPTFTTMGAPSVMPSANGVMVELDKPTNNNGIQMADSFNIYWSTNPDSKTGGLVKNMIANDRGPLFLGPPSVTPSTDYFFSVAPVVGGVEQAAGASLVSGPFTTNNLSGGTSISGTVNLSAVSGLLSGSTPLYMAAVDESNGVFVTGIAAPTASQSYIIPGVQPGYYSIYAILDLNNSGTFDFGTLLNRTNDKSQPIVMVPTNAPASMPAGDITLTPKSAQVKVTTMHSRSNSSDFYNLQFSVASVNRQVVNVQIGTGPQVSGLIDLSSSSSGDFWYGIQVPARPVVGDSYPVTVYYASGSPASETIDAVVTAVLDNFVTPTYPPASGTVSIPSGKFPNFAWKPASPNGYFTYQASINNNGGGGEKSLPLYSLSGRNQSYLSDGSYMWNLTVQDDFGNQAMVQNSFTVSSPATPPSISGFTPSGKAGDTITIDGSGFSYTLADNKVSFNGSTPVTALSVNGAGTQLTAAVPNNTPLSGPLSVTVNGVRAISNGEFIGTIQFEGYIWDKTNTGPISGATATLVENPAVTANANGTNGLFSFPKSAGIPSGRLYSMRYSTAGVGGYLDTYTHIMSNGKDVLAANGSTNNLFTDDDLSGWGVTRTSGKGVIRTKVQNLDTGSPVDLPGAVVTATSKMHPDVPYTVKYTDGSGNVSTDIATNSNGMFYVLDVDEGDYVTVTASKADMAFNTRTFVTHGNAVHQGSLRGGSIATSNATLSSGNYSGAQTTTLYVGASPADPLNSQYKIVYTTNGNDPTMSGTEAQSPVNIDNFSSTMTVKFFAKNKNAGFAVETPYNTRVYNFDGAISGRVTDFNGGAGIPNMSVQLFDSFGNPLPQSVNTDSSGNYTLSGLTSGTYKVCFWPGSTNYIAQCYNGILPANSQTATPFTVSAPATTTDINAALTLGGIITGQVTNGSTGIQNVSVELRDINGNWVNGINMPTTDASGNYTFGGLPTGVYKVYFNGSNAGYSSQWYNNKTDSDSADELNVTAGSTYPLTTAVLTAVPPISVSGSVVDISSTPLSGATIEQLYATNNATSAGDGTFTISNIPGSMWFELKMTQGSTYVPTYTGWLNSSTNLTVPSPYTLFTPTAVSSVLGISSGKGAVIGRLVNSANLSVAISGGTVTIYGPSPSYVVRYFDSATQQFTGTTATDTSGMFLVKDVEDGANIGINATIGTGGNGNLNISTHAPGVSEIAVPCYVPSASWGNLQFPSNATISTSQSLTAGGQVYLYNVTNVAPGPAIGLTAELGYGPVGSSPTDPSWVWTSAVYNTNYSWANNNHEFVATISAPASGFYDYIYRYSYFGGQYTYGDLNGIVYGTPSSPGKLTVTPPVEALSGQVTDSLTVGIPGVQVSVYNATSGNLITSTTTNVSGNYTVYDLPSGSYKLQYFKSGYATQWYSNKTSLGAADPVSVTAPVTTTLNRVTMQVLSVSGNVYTTAGVPVDGATVTIVGFPTLTATTAADGGYTIKYIPTAQNFQIMASKATYVDAFSATYNSSGNNINARELVLFTPAEVGGISPTMGGIFGQTILTGGLGTPIDGATVTIVSSGGGPYTVLYDNGSGPYLPGGPTSTSGRFFIPFVADGDTVVLSASRSGWTMNGQKSYIVHANSVTQGNLAGTFSTTTTVTLTSGSNPSIYGNVLTFMATVSPATAIGSVQFKVDGNNVGSPVTLVSGSATSAISSMSVGTHTVTAVFSGQGYSASTSAGVSQTVTDGIKIGSTGISLTLQNAIDTAFDTNTLLLRDTRFAEDLIVKTTPTHPLTSFIITLKGGLTSDFITPSGTATSVKTLRIQEGRVNAIRVVVKPN